MKLILNGIKTFINFIQSNGIFNKIKHMKNIRVKRKNKKKLLKVWHSHCI